VTRSRTGPAPTSAPTGTGLDPNSARARRRAERIAAREKRASPTGRSSVLLLAVLAACFAWAAAATWFALESRNEAARLVEEKEDLRVASEERVRALTRRLVGVASHQVLEQDGLEGRLADLITRQVELENRQAALATIAEQAGASLARLASPTTPAATAPQPPVPVPPARTRQLTVPAETEQGPWIPVPEGAQPALRLGGPAAPPSPAAPAAPAAARPASVITPPALPDGASDPLAPPLVPLDPTSPRSQMSLPERFAELEAAMGRLDTSQVRSLVGLERLSQHRIVLIRSTLAEIGLDPDRLESAQSQKGVGGPFLPAARHPTPFHLGVEGIQKTLVRLDRLRPVLGTLPFRRPMGEGDASMSSNFGLRTDPFTGASAMHSGIDFRAPEGTPVKAPAAGRVITADPAGGYGNLVEIDHGHGVTTRYGHLSAFSVSRGQMVAVGDVVGLVGSTGRSTGPHLHYETRLTGAALDPNRFIQAGQRLFAASTAPR
jgi:murein DD-endopeptidase MepM/ murein hydrolase activator NlpD/tellurite resistance protein